MGNFEFSAPGMAINYTTRGNEIFQTKPMSLTTLYLDPCGLISRTKLATDCLQLGEFPLMSLVWKQCFLMSSQPLLVASENGAK